MPRLTKRLNCVVRTDPTYSKSHLKKGLLKLLTIIYNDKTDHKKVNYSYFKIQIFMLESESGESAIQKIRSRIRNPPMFWPDCHPCSI